MSSDQQPHDTTVTKETRCVFFKNGCKSNDTISIGDHLCSICYNTHPFAFEKHLTENPHLRATFFQARPGETTPAYRNQHTQSCVSRRHGNRNEPWVARLIEARISREAAERADARKVDAEAKYPKAEDAVMCLPPNRSHYALCKLCGEVWKKDESFSKDFPDSGVTVTRDWKGDRVGMKRALKDINEAKVAEKIEGQK